MYLSKLLLDPASRRVQNELSNRYELHRTLTAQFPSKQRRDINLLYRIEMPERQVYQPITLLVQTQVEPDWAELAGSNLLMDSPQVKSFDPNLPDGVRYYFRLLGNPTIRRKQSDGNSKRVGLYNVEEQMEWLHRKARHAGFQVKVNNLKDHGMLESVKKKNNRTFQIKHYAVQFEGVLRISDPVLFKKSLVKGIGSAKAFGFGLLSLSK